MATATQELTISNRSRNLAISWTNQPVQRYNKHGEGHLVIDDPGAPRRHEYGSLLQCERDLGVAARINRGNDWTWALFVRPAGESTGWMVTAYWGWCPQYSDDDALDDTAVIAGRECWLEAGRRPIGLMDLLQAGQSVRVQLEEANNE